MSEVDANQAPGLESEADGGYADAALIAAAALSLVGAVSLLILFLVRSGGSPPADIAVSWNGPPAATGVVYHVRSHG